MTNERSGTCRAALFVFTRSRVCGHQGTEVIRGPCRTACLSGPSGGFSMFSLSAGLWLFWSSLPVQPGSVCLLGTGICVPFDGPQQGVSRLAGRPVVFLGGLLPDRPDVLLCFLGDRSPTCRTTRCVLWKTASRRRSMDRPSCQAPPAGSSSLGLFRPNTRQTRRAGTCLVPTLAVAKIFDVRSSIRPSEPLRPWGSPRSSRGA